MPDSNSSLIDRFKFERPDLLAFFLCAVAFVLWLNLLIVKFVYFGYYDWDLAMYAQATWALSHGVFHSSLFGTNFLTNHAEYISFFIAPFYRLFPSAFTLIVFKILSLTGGAFFFYLISKKLLGWRVGIIMMLLYLLHPANAFMMIYEFHFENLAIIFIFMMYYFLLEDRLIPFLVSAFFATLVKENISLVVFMFGIYAFFTKKEKRISWLLGSTILGGAFFILTMFVITPHLRIAEGITSASGYLWVYWKQPEHTTSFLEVLSQNFSARWETFISPLNLHYLRNLFLPFHILSFLSPLTLFLGLPIFAQHFLASSQTMHSLFYHYAATAIIFVFLSVAESLALIKNKLRFKVYFLTILITLTIYTSFVRSYLPEFELRVSLWHDRLDPTRENMLKQVPAGVPIISSFDFLYRLVDHKELFSLYNVWQNYGTFTRKSPFVLPADLSYALIDWNCPWLWGDLLQSNSTKTKEYLTHLHDFYFNLPWKTVDANEEITLLTTTPQRTLPSRLVENSETLFPGVAPFPYQIKVGDTIKLVRLTMDPNKSLRKDILPLEFIWQSAKKTDDFLAVEITILRNNKIIVKREHPVGYAFNATPLWSRGQYIKEQYNLLLPNLNPGEYTLNISFANFSKNRFEKINFKGKNLDNLNIMKFKAKQGESHEK